MSTLARMAEMHGRDSRPAEPEKCGHASPDGFRCDQLADHEPNDDHRRIATDVDEDGQVIRIDQWFTGRPEMRSHIRVTGTHEPNTVDVFVTDMESPDTKGHTTRTRLDAKGAAALMRYLAQRFPATGLMGALAEVQTLREERRMHTLPNETLVNAATEARTLYASIATRLTTLGIERRKLSPFGAPGYDPDAIACIDGRIAELESVSAALKAAAVATLPQR